MRRSSLKDPVLVLNKLWQPVGVSGCKKVITKMFRGHGAYIDMYTHPLAKRINSIIERLGELGNKTPSAADIFEGRDPIQDVNMTLACVQEAMPYLKPSFIDYPLSATEERIEGWLDLSPKIGQAYIQCKRIQVVAPHVVRFDSYDKMPKMRVKFNRHNVLVRDDGKCQYCGVRVVRNVSEDHPKKLQAYTWDHVIPTSKEGRNCWTNVVTACMKCNNLKADRTLEECGFKLTKRPVEPEYNIALIRHVPNRPACWSHFLGDEVEAPTVSVEKVT